jgi:hypothetical protein
MKERRTGDFPHSARGGVSIIALARGIKQYEKPFKYDPSKTVKTHLALGEDDP